MIFWLFLFQDWLLAKIMNGTAWLLSMYKFCKKNLALISIFVWMRQRLLEFYVNSQCSEARKLLQKYYSQTKSTLQTIEKDSFTISLSSQWNMAQKINKFWPHFEHCVTLTEMPAAQKHWSVWKVFILFAFLNKNTHSFIKKAVKYWMNIRCGRVMADDIAYAKIRKNLLIW